MGKAVSDALAPDTTWQASSGPGDEYTAVFREARGHRKAMLAGAACACLSAALIVVTHTQQSVAPQSGKAPKAPAPIEAVAVQEGVPVNRVRSASEMLTALRAHQLWEMPANHQIPPVLFANYPDDFNLLDVATKKKAFLHALLPAALLARTEIDREREGLEKILAKLDNPGDLVFDDGETAWQERLSEPEVEFIDHLADKYRSRTASDLLARVDTFPVSLIMAQAAMESSWGTSRFAEKGNNIFGMWTWGEQGLVPADREDGKDHKIAVYDTILGSVRAYLLTLNRLPAYRSLRQLRRNTRDPLRLVEGLHRYSERGTGYVAELKQIIRYNQLRRYDRYSLAGELPAGIGEDVKLSRL